MTHEDIHKVIAILREERLGWRTPAVTEVSASERSPFKVLVSCVISLRTKDEVTAAASSRLFAQASTPQQLAMLGVAEIARLIYPAGFYRVKAEQLHSLSERLCNEFGGEVPDTLERLLEFKGVGRKTANLVLTLGFGKPGICVDTHVHRICNRWGYVSTSTPEQTELALRRQLPGEYWIEINDLLVAFGQNLCHPVSPRCSRCPLTVLCPRAGVCTSR